MRRIKGVKPMEVSMCKLSANRRMLGLWKSATKPGARAQESKPMNIQDAISNTSPGILRALGDVAKSVSAQDGREYTPQAASIIKAVGRLLAPFAEELTLSDLQAVGKAAGLGTSVSAPDADETAPAFKSAAKGDPDEDEEDAEYDGDDAADGEEEDPEDDDEDEEDEEDADEATSKSAAVKIAAGANLSQAISKAASDEDDEADTDEDDMEEKKPDKKGKGLPPAFLANIKDKGKNKGDKVTKSAHQDQSLDSRFDEIMAKHRQLAEENKTLREAMNKSRADLDAERDFRQLEAIKKSIHQDYGHLGLDAEKYAPVLKAAKESDNQANYEALTELLKSCNAKVAGAQAASGIFEAVGKSSAASAASDGVAWSDRIEAAVDEQMKKSQGQHRAVVYDKFIQTPEGREMLKNHRRTKGRI